MKVMTTAIPGVLIVEPRVFGDHRGYFLESWQQTRYGNAGLPEHFVQDNQALSSRGVLRGLHVQHPHSQGKLVQVLQGEVFDVAVDIRLGSPTFGRWEAVRLSGEHPRQFYVPPGFAHGYLVLSDTALFLYKCSEYYHPEHEYSVLWNDPALAINWPLEVEPKLSDKDRQGLRLHDIPEDRLPRYTPTGA